MKKQSKTNRSAYQEEALEFSRMYSDLVAFVKAPLTATIEGLLGMIEPMPLSQTPNLAYKNPSWYSKLANSCSRELSSVFYKQGVSGVLLLVNLMLFELMVLLPLMSFFNLPITLFTSSPQTSSANNSLNWFMLALILFALCCVHSMPTWLNDARARKLGPIKIGISIVNFALIEIVASAAVWWFASRGGTVQLAPLELLVRVYTQGMDFILLGAFALGMITVTLFFLAIQATDLSIWLVAKLLSTMSSIRLYLSPQQTTMVAKLAVAPIPSQVSGKKPWRMGDREIQTIQRFKERATANKEGSSLRGAFAVSMIGLVIDIGIVYFLAQQAGEGLNVLSKFSGAASAIIWFLVGISTAVIIHFACLPFIIVWQLFKNSATQTIIIEACITVEEGKQRTAQPHHTVDDPFDQVTRRIVGHK